MPETPPQICGVCGDPIDAHGPYDPCGEPRDVVERAPAAPAPAPWATATGEQIIRDVRAARILYSPPEAEDDVLAAVIERTARLVEDYLDGRRQVEAADPAEIRSMGLSEAEEADALERIALAAEQDEPISPPDLINHPPHYTSHPSGIEAIEVVEHFGFCVGNAIKYLWRAGLKDGADALDDLGKAAWYVQRELDRLTLLAEQAAEK